VLACESHEWHSQNQRLITRGALTEADANLRYVGRVLVVEDNQVNQMVAKSFLERHGCIVTLADNGAEGVKVYESGQFDLVFMDMQMPVMDGLTATRKIRDFEGWRPRTPIVALTANAMAGQAERCIAAGMDGFLTKPLESARLREVLNQYLRRDDANATSGMMHRVIESSLSDDAASVSGACVASHARYMDWSRFDAMVAGETEFARELIEVFLASAVQTIGEMRVAADAGDRLQWQRAVHKLKGASANLCAATLSELCHQLETSVGAAQQSTSALVSYVDEIAQTYQNTTQELQKYLARS
jgi:two-component system, sensor histidine kinase and response regulator